MDSLRRRTRAEISLVNRETVKIKDFAEHSYNEDRRLITAYNLTPFEEADLDYRGLKEKRNEYQGRKEFSESYGRRKEERQKAFRKRAGKLYFGDHIKKKFENRNENKFERLSDHAKEMYRKIREQSKKAREKARAEGRPEPENMLADLPDDDDDED